MFTIFPYSLVTEAFLVRAAETRVPFYFFLREIWGCSKNHFGFLFIVMRGSGGKQNDLSWRWVWGRVWSSGSACPSQHFIVCRVAKSSDQKVSVNICACVRCRREENWATIIAESILSKDFLCGVYFVIYIFIHIYNLKLYQWIYMQSFSKQIQGAVMMTVLVLIMASGDSCSKACSLNLLKIAFVHA